MREDKKGWVRISFSLLGKCLAGLASIAGLLFSPGGRDITEQSTSQLNSNGPHLLYFWTPVALGVTVASIAVALMGWSQQVQVLTVLILVLSALAGWILLAIHKKAMEQEKEMSKSSLFTNSDFHRKVLPIWSSQIESYRTIGDKEVARLTDTFSEIVVRLGRMLEMASHSTYGGGQETDFLAFIEKSKTDFKSVFEELKAALEVANESKDMILGEATMFYASIREMADDAKQVAMQSKIIALNAEIEAARAGDAGKAFAAVVSEMRVLSTQSAEANEKMMQKVKAIDSSMTNFYKEEEDLIKEEKSRTKNAEKFFADILVCFSEIAREMEKSIITMESESRGIKDDISNSLVALQFQDRVSQMMAHLRDNIDELAEILASNNVEIDAEAWVNSFEKHFTVDEEFELLRGKKRSNKDSDMITIF